MFVADRNLVGFLHHANALHLLVEHSRVLDTEPTIAAKLVCQSIKAIRRAADANTLQATGASHRKISLAALTAWRGHFLTIEDWQRVAHHLRRRGYVACQYIGATTGYLGEARR